MESVRTTAVKRALALKSKMVGASIVLSPDGRYGTESGPLKVDRMTTNLPAKIPRSHRASCESYVHPCSLEEHSEAETLACASS